MKNKYLLTILAIICIWGCQKEVMPEFSDIARLKFSEEEEVVYSFYYEDRTTVVRDTVWVELETTGRLADSDRVFQIKQSEAYILEVKYDDTGNVVDTLEVLHPYQMVPDKHYISFDSEEMKRHFVVKSDSNTVRIPIVFLRDTTFRKFEYALGVTIDGGDEFELLNDEISNKVFLVNDYLSKPAWWNSSTDKWYFGLFSIRKFEFMHDIAGEPLNDEWMDRLFADFNEMTMYRAKFKYELNKYNADLSNIEAGLAPMREDQSDPNSPLVVFP